MKHAFRFAKRFLAEHPQLRRRIVNLIYRFPILDRRLRRWLQQSAHRPAALTVDAAHLGEAGRTARDRILSRIARR